MANEIRQLTKVEEWEEALKSTSERPMLLFKHSTSCPISAGAHEAYTQYVEDAKNAKVDFAIVHVIEDRPVSNAAAETLGVQHQSPQAILIQDGKPVWNESHWRITYEFLSEKLGEPESSGR
ncbi:bacillithiol system redox-active protein YtxJ [Cohnella pontilimi]|uniref:Bacillithiol system redox-active protein YtxJ n=1 Tax=Cohnella pontilimi TaxID=2564100 RepID=A0A4U0FER4_9BACL|nr:bacillithiol system redox-active protein YtxJ [Cohnella pontilimi]TJY43290.1 bacillithiol system redox-active protein YtxJ [Cohnella pontilimi]